MASNVKIKRSATAGKVPLTTDLQLGELAVNTYDGKLYLKKNAGTDQVVEVGGAVGITNWIKKNTAYTAVVGDKILADTSPGTFTITLPASPQLGNSVIIADAGQWYNTNLTVARNGQTIEYLAEDLILNISSIQVEFVFDGSTWEVYAFTGPAELPTQVGNSGKYLISNGTNASWGSPSEVPAQTGNSGKYLTTNGTVASWADTPLEIPTQTSNAGKYLSTDGTTLSWTDNKPVTSATALTLTSGTSANFTGIPAGVKKITMTLVDVGFAAVASLRVRLGTSSGLVSTGYTWQSSTVTSTPSLVIASGTDGVVLVSTTGTATRLTGIITILNVTGNMWVGDSQVARLNDTVKTSSSGSITLGGTLDRVSLVSTSGAFSSGTINIMWE